MGFGGRALTRRGAAAALVGGLMLRDAWAQATQYQYDTLGRLRCVAFDDGGKVQYSYDEAGNRAQVVRAAPGSFTASIAITGSTSVNLRTLADAAGYDGLRSASITFTLASGVTIMGVAGAPNGGVAIDTGEWPAAFCNPARTLTLALQISGKAYGGGGRGGRGAHPGNAQVSGTGGDAINCRVPINITVNTGGEVKAGGGGGGGGGGWYNSTTELGYGGGGGGGGFPNGAGGAAGASSGGTAPTSGASGTSAGGGNGGAGNSVFFGHGGGAGGAGGGPAANGSNGSNATGSSGGGWTIRSISAGSSPGYAIRKNGHSVSVTNNGAISGTVG